MAPTPKTGIKPPALSFPARGKNAFDTPSKPDTSTSLVCTTVGTALPPTPSSAIDSKSDPWSLKRRRTDVSSDDANDEHVARPKSKRPCGIMDSMLDMYFDEASRPIRERQNQQGQKQDECVSTLADLSTRVTAVEKRSSDVHHLQIHMGTTMEKIAQMQHDFVPKKAGSEIVRHVEEQKDGLETLNGEHQKLVTTVNEHKAHLEGLIKKRVTRLVAQKLIRADNTELKTSITDLASKLEVAEKAAKALSHKVKSLETAGAGGLEDTITPIRTEVDALRKHVTSLQALRAKEEESPAKSKELTKRRVLKLIAPTQESLQTLEESHEQLSSTVHDIETKTGLSIASLESKAELWQQHMNTVAPKAHLDMQSLDARVGQLEKKVGPKADTVVTSTQASPATPATSATLSSSRFRTVEELGPTLDRLCERTSIVEQKVHLHKMGLIRHDIMFTENTEARNGMEALLKKQDEHLKMYVQKLQDVQKQAEEDRRTKEEGRKQAEKDKKKLRGELDRMNSHLQALAQELLNMKSKASAPSPASDPRLVTPKAEQRQNSHAETCKSEAYERLNQRVDSFWNLFSANKDFSESKFNQVERIGREQAQRIGELERVSNDHSHQIPDLRADMDNVRTETEEQIVNATTQLTSTRTAVESWFQGYAKTVEDNTAVLEVLEESVNGLKAAQPSIHEALKDLSASMDAMIDRMSKVESSHEAAVQAYKSAMTKLDPLHDRVKALETAPTSTAAPTSAPSANNTLAFQELRCDVDKIMARKNDDDVAARNFKKRITVLEENDTALETMHSTLVKQIEKLNCAFGRVECAPLTFVKREQLNALLLDNAKSLEDHLNKYKADTSNQIESLKLELTNCVEALKSETEKTVERLDRDSDDRCNQRIGIVKGLLQGQQNLSTHSTSTAPSNQSTPSTGYPSPPPPPWHTTASAKESDRPTASTFGGGAPPAPSMTPNDASTAAGRHPSDAQQPPQQFHCHQAPMHQQQCPGNAYSWPQYNSHPGNQRVPSPYAQLPMQPQTQSQPRS